MHKASLAGWAGWAMAHPIFVVHCNFTCSLFVCSGALIVLRVGAGFEREILCVSRAILDQMRLEDIGNEFMGAQLAMGTQLC